MCNNAGKSTMLGNSGLNNETEINISGSKLFQPTNTNITNRI